METKDRKGRSWKRLSRVQSGKWIVLGFILGLISQTLSVQVYFAGVIVIFFLIMGENRGMVQGLQTGRKEQGQNDHAWIWAGLSYALSGILILF